MEIRSTGIIRVLPSRETKLQISHSDTEISLKSLSDSKSYKFNKIFSKSNQNKSVWDYLIRGQSSLVSTFLSGTNTCLVTYGEVNSGKSYSLFSQEDGVDFFSCLFSDLFKSYQGTIGLSIFEILYSPEDRCERILDLLKISDFKPLPHTFAQDFVIVEASNKEEALYILDCAKELSQNFKEKTEGGFRCLNNRSHFFVRVVIEKFSLSVIDLAGSLPGTLSPEIRVKLGCDEQLNVTRIGLNQYRSIIWEMSKSPGIDCDVLIASRKSKLSQVIAPLLSMGKNYFLGTIKEDSEFEDTCKNLDVLFRAQNIVTHSKHYDKNFKFLEFHVFVQRNKVNRYWESSVKSVKLESKETLRSQISQMIQELDAPSISIPQDTMIIKYPSIDMPKNDTASLKMQIFQQDIEEIRVSNEVEIENLKLENQNLKQKIRSLQSNSDFSSTFELYEQEIAKLEKIIKSLREDQINSLTTFENSVEIIENPESDLETLQRKYKLSLKSASQYSKSLETSLLQHEKDLSLIKKNERKWLLTRRCFENISRKTIAQESLLTRQSKFLQLNESTFQEMIKELENLQSESTFLKNENSILSSSIKSLEEELKVMKDIASTSGLPELTLKRLHQNLKSAEKVQGDFVINLIKRLQEETPSKKQKSFIDNIIHEVETLSKALAESQTREKNLFEVLLALQSSLSESEISKETNKHLRKALIAQLI